MALAGVHPAFTESTQSDQIQVLNFILMGIKDEQGKKTGEQWLRTTEE